MNDNVVPINGQFRFAEQEKVWWPTEVVQYPDSPEGEDQVVTIYWLVTLLKRKDLEWMEQRKAEGRRIAERALRGEDTTGASMKVFEELEKHVHAHVHGQRGIVDEHGEQVDFSKNKKKLLENARLFNSAMTAVFAASSGALRKNSSAGAGG